MDIFLDFHKRTYRENPNNHEGSKRVGDATRLDGVADSAPPEEVCEVLDEEWTHQ